MHSESRRNFVKKSLATSVTISFAGLIRAHGQEGGGTTWSPNQSTYSSTNGGGTTTWNPNQSTTYVPNSTTWNPGQNTTCYPDSTTWNPEETTIVTTASVAFDLKGTASAASSPITFDSSGYGQLASDWAVGSKYKFKLKFFADTVDNLPSPHGDPLEIEVAGEYYRIGSASQFTTDRFGLKCAVIDQSDGTISVDRTGSIEPLLVRSSIGTTVDFTGGYYILYPHMSITNLIVKQSPLSEPKQARMTGNINFWTDVKKYLQNSSGTFDEVIPYDSSTDPGYPGGAKSQIFEVKIYSHAHVST